MSESSNSKAMYTRKTGNKLQFISGTKNYPKEGPSQASISNSTILSGRADSNTQINQLKMKQIEEKMTPQLKKKKMGRS